MVHIVVGAGGIFIDLIKTKVTIEVRAPINYVACEIFGVLLPRSRGLSFWGSKARVICQELTKAHAVALGELTQRNAIDAALPTLERRNRLPSH